jgi:hypothetical protein
MNPNSGSGKRPIKLAGQINALMTFSVEQIPMLEHKYYVNLF